MSSSHHRPHHRTSSPSSSKLAPTSSRSDVGFGILAVVVLTLVLSGQLGKVWNAWNRKNKETRSERLREELLKQVEDEPKITVEKDKAAASSSSGGGGGEGSRDSSVGGAGGRTKKRKGSVAKTAATTLLPSTEPGGTSEGSRSRSPSVNSQHLSPSANGGLPSSTLKRSASPSPAPSTSTSPSSLLPLPNNIASTSSSTTTTTLTPSSSDTTSLPSTAPSSSSSSSSKVTASKHLVPPPPSQLPVVQPPIEEEDEGADFQLVGPAGKKAAAASKSSKKAAKKAAAAASVGGGAKRISSSSSKTSTPPSSTTFILLSPPTPPSSTLPSPHPSSKAQAASPSSSSSNSVLVAQPQQPTTSSTTTALSSPSSVHAPSSSTSEWDWIPAPTSMSPSIHPSSSNAVASGSNSNAQAPELVALKTAFSEAQTEIERLQFQLAESRDARTLDSERRLKEWERREKELRIKVAEEEKRKWEVWDGERRGRESQLQYQLHHLSLQHASLVHHARGLENVLRELNYSAPSLLPTPTTSPTATIRRGIRHDGRRSPYLNNNGGGTPNGGVGQQNGGYLGVHGGMGVNGAGARGKEGGGQWGEEVEVDQSVVFSVLKNPPVIPQALLEKPREGSVDSGNSSSHSSTSLPDSLSHSPPELVFASIASYDMNAAPIRPISSNHNHHNHGRPQNLSNSSHIPSVVYPAPPSAIGSSSASASSGSSVASPTGSPSPSGETALLDSVEEEEVGGDLGSRRGRTRGGRPGGGSATSEGLAISVPSLSAKLSSASTSEEEGSATKEELDTPLFASILRPFVESASMPLLGGGPR